MKVVIQRVLESSVTIDGKEIARIGQGMLVLAGFESEDSSDDLQKVARKIAGLRIFNDEQGLMNLDIKEVAGELLLVSQFTLHAKTKKGNRPSFIKAAKPEISLPLYQEFAEILRSHSIAVQTGKFGANMHVNLINDGPVTLIIDSKNWD